MTHVSCHGYFPLVEWCTDNQSKDIVTQVRLRSKVASWNESASEEMGTPARSISCVSFVRRKTFEAPQKWLNVIYNGLNVFSEVWTTLTYFGRADQAQEALMAVWAVLGCCVEIFCVKTSSLVTMTQQIQMSLAIRCYCSRSISSMPEMSFPELRSYHHLPHNDYRFGLPSVFHTARSIAYKRTFLNVRLVSFPRQTHRYMDHCRGSDLHLPVAVGTALDTDKFIPGAYCENTLSTA